MARVKVKWLKKHQDYGYFADAVGEVEASAATELYKKGYLIILPDDAVEVKAVQSSLPSDLPGREILADEGFKSLATIKEAGESLKLIKGIKQKMYLMIMAYIAETEK